MRAVSRDGTIASRCSVKWPRRFGSLRISISAYVPVTAAAPVSGLVAAPIMMLAMSPREPSTVLDAVLRYTSSTSGTWYGILEFQRWPD